MVKHTQHIACSSTGCTFCDETSIAGYIVPDSTISDIDTFIPLSAFEISNEKNTFFVLSILTVLSPKKNVKREMSHSVIINPAQFLAYTHLSH